MQQRRDHLDALSSEDTFWHDADEAQRLLRERGELDEKIKALRDGGSMASDLFELCALAEDDAQVLAEIGDQAETLEARIRRLEVERMLSAPEDRSGAIVTIHPGAGGVESQDWSEMLMRMYLRWCQRQGYATAMADLQPGDEAGIKSASIVVEGAFAYGRLRAENGVHRLIRISPFDANARRHTSFAAVYVVPDLDEEDNSVEIRSEDLRTDTYRASGAGGQHVNRTESAVRLTHLPTGIVVQCQAERSQHKNRATAMKMLRGRLYEKQRQEQEAAFEAAYGGDKMAIGFGSQVRSYTMAPYRLVKDERTDHKVSNVDAVLDGDLDAFIETYLLKTADQRERAKKDGARG